jgi:Ran GTPase-activating protein (RanGAP) involved in mRNA processing and transport
LIFLNLSCNPLSPIGQKYVAEIVLNNKTLRQLSINSCGFDLNSLIEISSNLTENSTLELLYMDRPLLNKSKKDEVPDHLSRVLAKSRTLCDLSLKFFNILDVGAKLLSQALLANYSMISLNLECNSIGIAGAEALATYLLIRRTDSIKSLGLSYNLVGNDGAIALAEVLCV